MDDSKFPVAPESSSHGYRRAFQRGSQTTECSPTQLEEVVRGDMQHLISLVWTPERQRLLPPIEFPSLHAACRIRAISAARYVLSVSAVATGLTIAGNVYLLYLFNFDWSKLRTKTLAILIAGVIYMLGIFSVHAHDFYSARRFSSKYRADQIIAARYGHWLFLQKKRWWYVIPMCLVLVWILELCTPGISSMEAAGLMKEAIRHGEGWRLLTGPFLHASTEHVTANALILFLCLWQVESIAMRGTALFLVMSGFLVGSIFSVLFEPVDSLGASGGVFALLGFLLVFGWRYRTVLPPKFAYGFLFSIGITFVYGFLLSHIDNAAHLGGLLAGLLIGHFATGRQQVMYSIYVSVLGHLSACLFFLGFGLVFARHWYLGAGI